ncbi:site-specific integrase [Methylobacterium sp. Leaf125]|uniref:site-specific integrase n=1 Tax=Methylobacterium sp. Leaf125 TaxID=1736265 RepID=UPI001FCCFD2A|nr:site-specific integrase [Methylobacterium sp. Leaf125]
MNDAINAGAWRAPAPASSDSEVLPSDLVLIVKAYQRASKAAATLKAYRSDAMLFQDWCARYGFPSLPASPQAVAGFLSHEAEAGRAASTIGRRCAAIRYAHKLAGLCFARIERRIVLNSVKTMAFRRRCCKHQPSGTLREGSQSFDSDLLAEGASILPGLDGQGGDLGGVDGCLDAGVVRGAFGRGHAPTP